VRATDLSLPEPSVYDFVYPVGMVEGTAPATVWRPVPRAAAMYARFLWKTSSLFEDGPNRAKLAFFFHDRSAGQTFLGMRPGGGLSILPEIPGDFRWRHPNRTMTPVAINRYYLIEWFQDILTGELRWWVDGVLQGEYYDVPHTEPFVDFRFSPTFGGNSGATKQRTDHFYFANVILSIG
jgi:hypothetical protein